MALAEVQMQMIETINALGDCFDQYNYLIVSAQNLPPMSDRHKNDRTLVHGCQSKVWIYTAVRDGRLWLEGDSDTLILRGVLALLRQLFHGKPMEEVRQLEVTLFQKTELAATFTSDRNTGLQSILRRIQETPDAP